MKQKKKMAAALTAVATYIKSEQEAQMAAAQAAQAQASPQGMPAMNLWGLSGRQSQMQMRSLVQIKSFHGAKLR